MSRTVAKTRPRTRARTTRGAANPAPAGSTVYVLDAWDDATGRSVIAVFAARPRARRALTRLLERPGDWYAGVVKQTVQ